MVIRLDDEVNDDVDGTGERRATVAGRASLFLEPTRGERVHNKASLSCAT